MASGFLPTGGELRRVLCSTRLARPLSGSKPDSGSNDSLEPQAPKLRPSPSSRRSDPATCEVNLRYRYSERANWPPPVKGETSFLLKWADFIPSSGFVDISALVAQLLYPITQGTGERA